jgi:hypothetical protein
MQVVQLSLTVPHALLVSLAYVTQVPLVPPLQHPPGQVLTSHVQVPAVVSHTPFPHGEHAAPPVPHWAGVSDAYGTQVLPLQQPFGQEVTLQTHSPLPVSHSWPVAHEEQLAPATPQEPFVSEPYATQVRPLQQPFGQDVALQTHWPFARLHTSSLLQASHVAPPDPHKLLLSLPTSRQLVPLQQPLQLPPPPQPHLPPEQVSPIPHALHCAPPVPHSVDVWEAKRTQVLPLQHPPAQDAALHTHCPLVVSHTSFVGQAAHVAPAVPHEVIDSEAYASQVPLAPPLQQPFGHVFASHAQTPSVVSQSPLGHDAHAAPPVPHCAGDSDV